MSKQPERIIDTTTGVLLMLATGFSVLVIGAITAVFSAQYESTCNDSTGKVVCTQTFKFKGWEAIPLQGLPGAIGTGIGIYAAVKSGKFPGMRQEEESPDVSSGS